MLILRSILSCLYVQVLYFFLILYISRWLLGVVYNCNSISNAAAESLLTSVRLFVKSAHTNTHILSWYWRRTSSWQLNPFLHYHSLIWLASFCNLVFFFHFFYYFWTPLTGILPSQRVIKKKNGTSVSLISQEKKTVFKQIVMAINPAFFNKG